jgi:chromosome segregation ATPase
MISQKEDMFNDFQNQKKVKINEIKSIEKSIKNLKLIKDKQSKDLHVDKDKNDQCVVIKQKISDVKLEVKKQKETRLSLEKEMQSNHKLLTELNDRIRQNKKQIKDQKKDERKALEIDDVRGDVGGGQTNYTNDNNENDKCYHSRYYH